MLKSISVIVSKRNSPWDKLWNAIFFNEWIGTRRFFKPMFGLALTVEGLTLESTISVSREKKVLKISVCRIPFVVKKSNKKKIPNYHTSYQPWVESVILWNFLFLTHTVISTATDCHVTEQTRMGTRRGMAPEHALWLLPCKLFKSEK